MRKLLLSAVTLCLFLTSYANSAEITFESTSVGDGLYVLQGVGGFAGGNIMLSVGDDGVVMIDDSMPPLLTNLKKAISEITPKPITFLVNTHVHQDHTGNNASFGGEGVHIIGHDNLRTRLQAPADDGSAAPTDALPVITFPNEITFHLNGDDARVFHLEMAHTDGDVAIYFKKANVLHTGDVLFNGLFPFIDTSNGGSVQGYIAAQKLLYSIADENTVIVPGHGPLAKRADLKAALDMLEDSVKRVAKLHKKGMSEDEVVAKNPLKKYHEKWNWDFITTEKITRTIYQSL
ncbi:MBL fold metallo-hydrolase [Teredinibacter turnerae]|uniref:MBL fold metallo-hydrolase n=1 Tax=Teredinibacter turnerae TaxID=2426 RepID=UPI0030D62297